MNGIVFDSSSIISLSMNNLLWVLAGMKKHYSGEFFIPEEIKREVVDVPLNSKTYGLKALQVREQINSGVLRLYRKRDYLEFAERVGLLVNNMFYAFGNPVKLMHSGEISALALAKMINADALAVDERSTRVIIENPLLLKYLLEKKLHTKIEVNMENVRELTGLISGMGVIRSSEICFVANEFGLFRNLNTTISKLKVLDAVLWAVKVNGCSISAKEIEDMKRGVAV